MSAVYRKMLSGHEFACIYGDAPNSRIVAVYLNNKSQRITYTSNPLFLVDVLNDDISTESNAEEFDAAYEKVTAMDLEFHECRK